MPAASQHIRILRIFVEIAIIPEKHGWQGEPRMVPNIMDDWNAAFRTHLSRVDAWLEKLHDDLWPQTGRRFHERFMETGCSRVMNARKVGCTADYTDFIHPPATGEKSFRNSITYGHDSLFQSYAHLFSAHVHESFHALQRMVCAATHASPCNADTNIILCPRDFALLMERTDQEAYAKQAWFNHLFCNETKENPSWTERDPVSVQEFLHHRNNHQLQKSLACAAHEAMFKPDFLDIGNNKVFLRDSIHSFALAAYKAAIEKRLAAGEKLTLVRLEAQDIMSSGTSFGPNPFGVDELDPLFAGPALLSPDHEKLVMELNALTGITDERMLPLFGEALEQAGLTRESFIERSRAGRLETPMEEPQTTFPPATTTSVSAPLTP